MSRGNEHHIRDGELFTEALPYGYIYAGKNVDMPGRFPFVRESRVRSEELTRWKDIARRLEAIEGVVRATVYRAVLIPPVDGVPRCDVISLIETSDPGMMSDIRGSEEFGRLGADFVTEARNVRRIGDTQEPLSGTFLFNHFTAGDGSDAVGVWEDMAGWYVREIGIDNSTLLEPMKDSRFAIVNYVRLPNGPVSFLLKQLVRPGFHTFVRRRLRENDMVAMPVLCQPV